MENNEKCLNKVFIKKTLAPNLRRDGVIITILTIARNMNKAHRAIAHVTSIVGAQAVTTMILFKLKDDLMKIGVISVALAALARAVVEEVEDIFRVVGERVDEELIETKVLLCISTLKTRIIKAKGLRILRPQTDYL